MSLLYTRRTGTTTQHQQQNECKTKTTFGNCFELFAFLPSSVFFFARLTNFYSAQPFLYRI